MRPATRPRTRDAIAFTSTRKTTRWSRSVTARCNGSRASSERSTRIASFSKRSPSCRLQGDRQTKRNYELLVRMRDESGRVVPPGAFLPAVERYNLSQRLDRWVITTRCNGSSTHRPQIERVSRDLHQSVRRFGRRSATAEFIRQSDPRNGRAARAHRLRNHRDRGHRQSDARQPADRRSARSSAAPSASTTSAAASRRSPT